jgi:hypothetical protein
VSKFELYKHNDEPLNIYYGIFYELWTFADFSEMLTDGRKVMAVAHMA